MLGFAFRVLLVLAGLLLFTWCLKPSAKPRPRDAKRRLCGSAAGGGDDDDELVRFLKRLPRPVKSSDGQELRPHDWPAYEHTQAICWPGLEFMVSNTESLKFETDLAWFEFVFITKPTLNPELDVPGGYPYSDHMRGKKRKWETRTHVKFKRPVDSRKVKLGCSTAHVPMNAASKRATKVLTSMVDRVCGGLYHSFGDGPESTEAEREAPTGAVPIWAYDQVIVTPEGEEPPKLTDPNFYDYGSRRNQGKKEHIRFCEGLDFRPGPTYTFAFWCISPYCDPIRWTIAGLLPGMSIPIKSFTGSCPPILNMYVLQEPESPGETRHLESRRDYIYRLAFWSSACPPDIEDIVKVFPELRKHQEEAQDVFEDSMSLPAAKKMSAKRRLLTTLACCVDRSAHQ